MIITDTCIEESLPMDRPTPQTTPLNTAQSSAEIAASTMDSRLLVLKKHMEGYTDMEVFRHCVGLQQLPSIPPIAKELANEIIVIALDTEHWSDNTEEYVNRVLDIHDLFADIGL